MKLHWVGGPTFILELGVFRVLADPLLGDEISVVGGTASRHAPMSSGDFGSLDYVIVSRNRSDHIDAVAGAKFGNTKAIAPKTDVAWLAKLGLSNVETVDWWDSIEASKSGESLVITSMPTSHKESQESHGFLFQHRSGEDVRNVYWTGDTLWFSGAREIKARYDKLDLLLPVMGAVGGEGALSTLSGKEAMQFVFMAQPKRIVPVGYHTFSHYTEGVEDLKARIDLTMYEKRLVVLAEGDTFER